MYSNVRIVSQDSDTLEVAFNSAVFRTRQGVTVAYPSSTRVRLRNSAPGLLLIRKRIDLDLDHLATMGALTIIL
jgi:3-phenylpropionate/cinnamic acid dioxygenase small subunit